MPAYVCIHGHFYQPPRENPWLEAIERQESARPYHDWNERVTAECYEPNASARILNDDGFIEDLINNYSRISFNFGATLLSWMRRERRETYDGILRADQRSAERFGGHGSALAQGYGHLIMPLASTRDKRTQIRWGVEDFRVRFGRDPEGMWLPETAADLECLDLMAQEGIRFTILAPHQAAAVRPPDGEWQDVDQDDLETGRAYRVPLPEGREIAVFFYDGATSRAVAFEQLLTNGVRFAERLLDPLDESEAEAPLSHIATDGETYGHHHRHGEMALAYALRTIEEREDVALTNYGQYLELHPPTWEARIHDDTSWSCAHGVERWKADCGCAADPGRGWSQAWREPLRNALDWLRDRMEAPYEEAAGEVFDDPWEARDRYIDVLVDRNDQTVARFLEATTGRALEGPERIRALRLMELQRHLMLMYTSCGWFFDDLSGIETVQVLQYAGRAIHVANELFPPEVAGGLEEAFLDRLDEARSNLPEWGSGREVYRRTVDPARVDLRKAAAHYAVSSIFDGFDDDEADIYCYHFRRQEIETLEAGASTLLTGHVEVTSLITRHGEDLTFAVLHLGNHNLAGGVRPYQDTETYERLRSELEGPFLRTDFTSVIRILDREFEASTYSLRSLFRDAQLRIVDTLLESSVEEAEAALGALYEQRGPLLRFLADLDVPAPRPFVVAGEYVLNQRLERILEQDEPHLPAVRAVLESARASALSLDVEEVAYNAQLALERIVEKLSGGDEDMARMVRMRELIRLMHEAGVPLDLWRVQNAFWQSLKELGPLPPAPAEAPSEAPAPGSDTSERWRVELEALARALRVVAPVASAAEHTTP